MKAWMGALLAAAALLGGCGGGGGNPGTCHGSSETCEGVSGGGGGGTGGTDVTGLWIGTTTNARTAYALTLPNHQAWVIYSSAGNPNLPAGVIEGTYTVSGATLASTDALDVNFEGPDVTASTLAATVTPQQSITGTVTSPSAPAVGFTANYKSQYAIPATLVGLAGTYTGTAVDAAGQASATLAIDSAGNVTGTTASGCSFTGSAAPQAGVGVFDMVIRFAGAPCSNGTSLATGVAFLDSGRLYAAVLDAARSNGLVFAGPRL
jgi:hypothetical protein